QEKGLDLGAWCIMTSHVHLIIGSHKDKMENIMRDLKRHTSKAILKEIENNMQESRRESMLWMFRRAGKRNPNNEIYQFWQQNNQPIELNTNEKIDQRLHYLHYNPVEAGFVDEPWQYPYSSAKDYFGLGKGLIDGLFMLT